MRLSSISVCYIWYGMYQFKERGAVYSAQRQASHISSIANPLNVLNADLSITSFRICFPYTRTLRPFRVLPAPPALRR